jgi:signal transduction histidine kinase
MRKFLSFSWFKDIPIAHKLYFTVGIMAVLIGVELCTLYFAIGTLSSVRAFVNGEGLWSKAQKDAAYQLLNYAAFHKEEDYAAFKDYLKVPEGDSKTRAEIMKPVFDMSVARAGFIEGRNDSDDVPGMIDLFRRFHSISYINKAIIIWGQAEPYAFQLKNIGIQIHAEINSPSPSQDKINALVQQVEPINKKLTGLEDDFSFTLGEGSRWLEGVVLKLLFGIALSVELTGLLLAISVSRSMQKGLGEIISSASSFAGGALHTRARVFSNDEIGVLANSFNLMSDQLQLNIAELEEAHREFKRLNESLESKVAERTSQLERANNELDSFSYSVSHDLRAPLRSVNGFAKILKKKYADKLDDEGKEFLQIINENVDRMDHLIAGLLKLSRLERGSIVLSVVDLNAMVRVVVEEMKLPETRLQTEVRLHDLKATECDPVLLKQVWTNLISNAIKYSSKKEHPVIEIGTGSLDDQVFYYVKDNGVGFNMEYASQLFVAFRRLHEYKDFEGTGVGLTLVQRIIHRHGGKIWVEAEEGKGATFYFTLSEAPAESEADSVNMLSVG